MSEPYTFQDGLNADPLNRTCGNHTQVPELIVVGEMRDRDPSGTGIGHLCLSTPMMMPEKR
ncbi:hypothetical protein J1782_07200 [Rahnella sp. BCC 1045]|uniref:type IV pilus twitching motility protein PilT n=1 Tax=Rahnella sp. BCC 1045 TaxID=2816251 RepID=UPI001C256789|nr:type IV pilus twitching motility protein PilT [Rahnella sp. BCC 1045]MBU9819672.1 hypothetical protein [Rahnella sp. BCC 1045]